MTHSWTVDQYDLAPGLILHQHLSGGPDLAKGRLTESIEWSIINLEREVHEGRGIQITQEQAVQLLERLGYRFSPGKSGLCSTPIIIAEKDEES
jgi:hypothetical protein